MASSLVIVDDHAGFRRSARRLLESDGFVVVGEAADGASGIAQVRTRRPRVVLVDVVLPDIDGFAVAELLADEPEPVVVVLTSSREATDLVTRLARSPAKGFVHKGDLTGAALSAIVEAP
jgi:DNA-binding NarL/FixJ family response regulator